MNKFFIIFLVFPTVLFGQEKGIKGLLKVDVVVKVISEESEELWSFSTKKYTVSQRSVSINLKGFDGELIATLNPVVVNDDLLLLKTSSIVKNLDTGSIIKASEKDLLSGFNEEIVFYPIGNLENVPNVILILNITKFGGVDAEN